MCSVKIFTKSSCPKCPAAKAIGVVLQRGGLDVSIYDIETPSGLAEAAFYGVLATPTIIVADEKERVLAGWRGAIPSLQEIEGVARGK